MKGKQKQNESESERESESEVQIIFFVKNCFIKLPVYTSSNSMAQLGWNQGPKNQVPLQIMGRIHRLDNVICPFYNNWELVRIHPDVDRKNIRWELGHNWLRLRLISIASLLEFFLTWLCMSRALFHPRLEPRGSPRPCWSGSSWSRLCYRWSQIEDSHLTYEQNWVGKKKTEEENFNKL